MIELFTSRWANRALADLRCQPVGISRGTPRFPTGYRYKVLRELAPDDETWRYQDPETFRASYERQLEEIGLDAIVGRLERIAEEGGGLPLVLLCFEDVAKPGQWCHRTALRHWLTEHGVEVEELQPGMLPLRPDAPQQALF